MTYRWVDHTAEVELHIEAETQADVFADALAAFAELVGDEDGGEPVRHELVLSASDRAGLLAAWLEELVFLTETEAFVPEHVERLELGEDSLQGTVAGRRGSPSNLVKAVTYHRLEFACDREGCRARVVLDV